MSGAEGSSPSAADHLAWIDSVISGATEPSLASVTRLCGLLATPAKAVQRRAAEALALLAPSHSEVEARLTRLLEEASPSGRWGAAFALARLDALPEGALPVLTAALSSFDGDVRWAACDMLVRRTGAWRDRAIAALVALAREGDLRQRKMALYALRDLDHRGGDSEDAARRALAAADSDLRLAGMAALVRLSDDRTAAARTVAALLTDCDVRVRRAAAGTLGRLACADAVVCEALSAALADSDESTVRAARAALARLRR